MSVRLGVMSPKVLNEFKLNLVLMVKTKMYLENLCVGLTESVNLTKLKSNFLLKVSHRKKYLLQ